MDLQLKVKELIQKNRENIQVMKDKKRHIDTSIAGIGGVMDSLKLITKINETSETDLTSEFESCVERSRTIPQYHVRLMPFSDGVKYVYVLELENDNYYVGYTENFDTRMVSHFGGAGSMWTKLHKPKSVLEVFRGDKGDEHEKTIQLMMKHGYQKVRGGRLCQTIMNRPPMELSKRMKLSDEDGL